MPRHRSHSIEFKRQVAQEFIGGSGSGTRAFDDDAKAAELLQEQQARIAALERLVGRQALELEFLKKEMRSVRSGSSMSRSSWMPGHARS